MSTEVWLRLLRVGTTTFAAQPYQHLAAIHRAAVLLLPSRHDAEWYYSKVYDEP